MNYAAIYLWLKSEETLLKFLPECFLLFKLFLYIYTICAYININNRKLELTAFELFSLVNVSSFNSIHPSDRTPTLIEKSCQLADTKDKFKDKREIPQCSKNEQITNSYIIQEKIIILIR